MIMKITDFIAKYYYLIIPVFLFVLFLQTSDFGLVGFEDKVLLQSSFSRIATSDRMGSELIRSYLETDNYRPITNLYYWSVAQVAGNNSLVFRTFNFLLLSLISILLVSVFKIFKFSKKTSVISSILLTIHPVLFASMGWIPSSSILLSALFGLLSVWIYYYYLQKSDGFLLFLHFISVFMAIGSHESAFVIPFILAAWMFFTKEKKVSLSQKIQSGISWISAIALYFLMMSKSTFGLEVSSIKFENIFINLQLLPEIVSNFFAPVNLPVLASFSSFKSLIGLFVIALLIVIGKFNNILNTFQSKMSLIWLILSTIPFMLIIPFNAYNFYDYQYIWGFFASIGLMIYLAQLIEKIDFKNKMYSVGFIVVLMAISFLSFYNVKNYQSEKEFYLNANKHNPGQAKILLNLFEIYNQSNEFSSAEKFLKKASELKLKDENQKMEILFKLSELYLNQNRIDESIEVLKKLVKEYDNFTAVYQIVSLYLQTGKVVEANELAKSQIRNEDEKVKILKIYDIWAKNYHKNKDNVTMMNIMKGVLVFDPNNLEVVNYILKTYIQLYEESKAEFLTEKIKFYINERNRILAETKVADTK